MNIQLQSKEDPRLLLLKALLPAVPRPRAPEPEFLLRDFEPSCFSLFRSGELSRRVEAGLRELEDCCACPRNCHVNRLLDKAKVCGTGRHAIVSSAFPHFGEENCLRGWNGSGTIFFGLCNLRCVFCQNWDISQQKNGAEYSADGIADLMLALQARGCHNINFVTPEHVVPQVIEAVAAAVPRGLNLPIVYNTSAYDSLESLRLMDGIVDIYMPDFKFWERESARQFAKAKDYPDRAREAILEMHRQVGPLKFNEQGLARRGVLVRHLVMPGQTAEAAAIFNWLVEEVSSDTYINIMDQYRPEHSVMEEGTGGKYASIARRPTGEELTAARAAARDAGLWRFDGR
ncbi:MAG: radical SAM protein [Gammaproteobacteria bacterium]|nr:radical SAM protein [Gammaproteobacteria bacterium]